MLVDVTVDVTHGLVDVTVDVTEALVDVTVEVTDDRRTDDSVQTVSRMWL